MSKVFESQLRVRYGETDQMGFVYYGNYALYLEVARTDLIRESGWSYKRLEEEGINLPVVNLNINYRKPAKYDDVLNIHTRIIGDIGKKICFSSEIYNERKELLVKGEVELIFVDSQQNKVVTCPEKIKTRLSQYQ